MMSFQVIKNSSEIEKLCPKKEWKLAKDTKKAGLAGTEYQVLKYQRPLSWSNPEKIGKMILGGLAVFFTGGIALCSKKVKKLLTPMQTKRLYKEESTKSIEQTSPQPLSNGPELKKKEASMGKTKEIPLQNVSIANKPSSEATDQLLADNESNGEIKSQIESGPVQKEPTNIDQRDPTVLEVKNEISEKEKKLPLFGDGEIGGKNIAQDPSKKNSNQAESTASQPYSKVTEELMDDWKTFNGEGSQVEPKSVQKGLTEPQVQADPVDAPTSSEITVSQLKPIQKKPVDLMSLFMQAGVTDPELKPTASTPPVKAKETMNEVLALLPTSEDPLSNVTQVQVEPPRESIEKSKNTSIPVKAVSSPTILGQALNFVGNKFLLKKAPAPVVAIQPMTIEAVSVPVPVSVPQRLKSNSEALEKFNKKNLSNIAQITKIADAFILALTASPDLNVAGNEKIKAIYRIKNSRSEVKAKKYYLALKMIHSLQSVSKASADLPPTYFSKKYRVEKPSPHTILISPECQAKKREAKNALDGTSQAVHFVTMEVLGDGSSNDVRSVFSLEEGKRLVYRTLKNELYDKDAALNAWEAEVELHKDLQQSKVPHLIPLYSSIEVNDSKTSKVLERSLLLEYCQKDLSDYIYQQDTVSSEVRSQFASNLLEFTLALHEKGFIHHDLKEPNIFIQNPTKLFIGDLGTSETPHAHYEIEGTLLYLPFEGVSLTNQDDIKLFSRSIDMWSIGIILLTLKKGWSEIQRDEHKATLKEINSFHELYLKEDSTITFNFEDFESSKSEFYKETMKFYPEIKEVLKKDFFPIFVYQQVVEKYFKEKFFNGFNEITAKLLESNDPYDQLILGLLEPKMEKRWSAEQAYQFVKEKMSKI